VFTAVQANSRLRNLLLPLLFRIVRQAISGTCDHSASGEWSSGVATVAMELLGVRNHQIDRDVAPTNVAHSQADVAGDFVECAPNAVSLKPQVIGRDLGRGPSFRRRGNYCCLGIPRIPVPAKRKPAEDSIRSPNISEDGRLAQGT
jgi:hypothetical protein